MKIKRIFTVTIAAALMFMGITQTASAAKPGVFSGQCVNTWYGAHQISFSNIPGGTKLIQVRGIGYLTYVPDFGSGYTDWFLDITKPFTAYDVYDGFLDGRRFYFDNFGPPGTYTTGNTTFTGFNAIAYGGSAFKTSMITF